MGVRFLILSLALLFSPLAEAAGLCPKLFSGEGQGLHAFDKINRENNHFLLSREQSENFIQNYPLQQKRFLRNTLNNIKFTLGLPHSREMKLREAIDSVDLTKVYDPIEIESVVSKLSLALYGHPYTVDRYLFQTKDQRTKQRAERIIGERILRDGFLQVWNGIPEKKKASFIKRVNIRIGKVTNWGPIKTLTHLPFPELPRENIPHELLEKIIIDGYDAHASEFQRTFKYSNAKDAYSTFRRFFGPIVLGLILSVSIPDAHEQIILEQELARQQLDDAKTSIDNLGSELIEHAQSEKERIVKETLESTISDFVSKWGEEPTPEEVEILRSKVFSELNYNP